MGKAADAVSFQAQLKGNHCFGCGGENPHGLHIQSFWAEGDTAVCQFTPEAYHCAAPTHFLNGGIIATVIDCHCICTAMADAYRRAGREIGQGEAIWYATGSLSLNYLRPVLISADIVLRADILAVEARTTHLVCHLIAEGKTAVEAKLTAVRVPEQWMSAKG
ncbi:PaaI family thioesterase [Photobacterium gaetbulicola]|uniref:Putative thioesterase superfamily protein n=1 Tax=Photobacterium gaetbulicola Gung47 TaxID=658445 RepID=A0A0C5WAL7_9GAMM|nr:thioesterase [Photobacterium gaetbulicola]AJR08631.1 putative thioesterase superfamily protein [Photobacterium gaetbulicola Gung47]PSU02928.1 PaaI family thioesterase [Photobacterium gaetbulicola]